MLRTVIALGLGFLAAFPALAQAPQTPPPTASAPQVSDAMRNLVGTWELSNPDRDRKCHLTFRLDPAPPGRAVSLAQTCAAAFPDLRAIAAWQMGSDDALKLVDSKGAVLSELTEVEAGMYETMPSHTHYFLQTLAAINKERITDHLFGEWQFTRGTTKVVCQMIFENTARDADSFALTVRPGCDQIITRFAPVGWRLDRGQLIMLAANGQSWRFEENEEAVWSRVPAMRPPLVMNRPPPAQ